MTGERYQRQYMIRDEYNLVYLSTYIYNTWFTPIFIISILIIGSYKHKIINL